METRARRNEPVACSLAADDRRERAERWRELFARARPTVTQIPLGLRLAFAPAPGVEQELQELAALERVCCAFADWSVSAAGSEVVLEVAADGPEAVAAVHAMFRL